MMRKVWKFLNSPLFDYIGGWVIIFVSIIFFIGYLKIDVDPLSFIFACLLFIGLDCMYNGGSKLFCKKRNPSPDQE